MLPPPPIATPSNSDEFPSTPSPPPSKYRATVDVEKVLLDIKDELLRSKSEVPVPQCGGYNFYLYNLQGDNEDYVTHHADLL